MNHSIMSDLKRIQRIFETVVTPERTEGVARENLAPPSLIDAQIDFVLAFVRDENAAKVSERIATVVSLAVAQHAAVYNVIGALVIMAFRTVRATPAPEKRRALVAALREQLAADVKIVHGQAQGTYGIFGRDTGMCYTFLVPKLDRILATLAVLDFGEAHEVTLE